MKNLKFASLAILLATISFVFSSCKKEEVKPQEDLLPKSFGVDIPSSISNNVGISGGRVSGRQNAAVNGNDIYKNLNTFISVGEGASKIVEAFIEAIRKYKIDRALSVSYTSDEDKRLKNLVVAQSVTFESKVWDFQLTITDADSEKNADGGKGLQIFWNNAAKVTGIAILKPYNTDRVKNANAKDAIFRIDYSETDSVNYDAEMTVAIAGLPVTGPGTDQYSINNLKMFAGKKGSVVDVFGNSNHPNAKLFSGALGFNWAFVASGNSTDNIGVAEVGLPASSLDSNDRKVLLKDNSIKAVFTREISIIIPGINQNDLAAYLVNTNPPGYFKNDGFITAGVSPGTGWNALSSRLESLSPFNPKTIGGLSISFK